MVLCFLTTENTKQNAKKKVWFVEDVKQPSVAGMMCNIDGEIFCSQRIPGSETQVHPAVSPMMILSSMMSPISMSPFNKTLVLCLL